MHAALVVAQNTVQSAPSQKAQNPGSDPIGLQANNPSHAAGEQAKQVKQKVKSEKAGSCRWNKDTNNAIRLRRGSGRWP